MKIFNNHPLLSLVNGYLIDAPQPSNISYSGNFGSQLIACISSIFIITAIVILMDHLWDLRSKARNIYSRPEYYRRLKNRSAVQLAIGKSHTNYGFMFYDKNAFLNNNILQHLVLNRSMQLHKLSTGEFVYGYFMTDKQISLSNHRIARHEALIFAPGLRESVSKHCTTYRQVDTTFT
jgi:hypothetical protein